MALNVERLLEELRFITIHPDKHDQEVWVEADVEVPPEIDIYDPFDQLPRPSACGSFGCLAGNTAIHEPGVELDWYRSGYHRRDGKRIITWQADDVVGEFVTVVDDWDGSEYQEQKSISQKAREVLGLTKTQADKLFEGDNTLDKLWEWAEKISAGEITADKDLYYSDYAVALRERADVEKAKASVGREDAK